MLAFGRGRRSEEPQLPRPRVARKSAQDPARSASPRSRWSRLGARESAALDFDFEDVADETAFNRILWRSIKGDDVPYPGTNRMSALEWKRGW